MVRKYWHKLGIQVHFISRLDRVPFPLTLGAVLEGRPAALEHLRVRRVAHDPHARLRHLAARHHPLQRVIVHVSSRRVA